MLSHQLPLAGFIFLCLNRRYDMPSPHRFPRLRKRGFQLQLCYIRPAGIAIPCMHHTETETVRRERERESHCRVMSASQTYLACDISHEGKCSTMNLRTSSLVAAQRLAWYEPINKPLIIYVRHHSQSSVWASSRDAIRVAQHTQLDAIGLKDRWYPHPQVQPAHCTEKRFRPRT
jgi:hypothetical protein